MNHKITIVFTIFISFIFNHECITLNPNNYGSCTMVLGWSWTGENCELISGCSTINPDGLDDSEYFYDNEYYCIQECTIHNSNYGDMNDDGVLDVIDVVIIINIILNNYDPNQAELWSADMNHDGIINIQDVILIIQLILNN